MLACAALGPAAAHETHETPPFEDRFRQLDEILPTANAYRTATGEPGHAYWQQKVDYSIDVRLDEDRQRISGSETITYHNHSPDTLNYLWLQLDQNRYRNDSIAEMTRTFEGAATGDEAGDAAARISLRDLQRLQYMEDSALGYEIHSVTDSAGEPLDHTVVGTLMRVDLPAGLEPGGRFVFSVDYAYNLVDGTHMRVRGGFERFPDDARTGGNHIFAVAQWFPRLAAYTDYDGWTNKEFLGGGEFTLEFGDYDVAITVPADHIVAATGELANAAEVLTPEQLARLDRAATAERPVFIVTPDEARENEREGASETATWRFSARNVRDFAWASSRKFIWDAKGLEQPGAEQKRVMAMSFYPKEGGTLWSNYSTEVVIHALEVYSRFTFDYPYPTAQSVSVGFLGGMEYPMISFNGPRTTLQEDGSRTYSLAEKRFLIRVIIHEIGHFFFPMIVNSDERQWTWMDEGLNSYLDAVAGREWDPEISWTVEPRHITGYMLSEEQVPIMTQSDSLLQAGPNAYGKPTAALNILRETIMGRELFDFAFREYARRWKFKRPTPADFFRTMEEASGVDLDWFWRGWFYTTRHVDISLDRVYEMRLDSEDPDIDFPRLREMEKAEPPSVFVERNREEGRRSWVEKNPDIRDFYDRNDEFTVTNVERNRYRQFLDGLEATERAALERAVDENLNYYILEFSNPGGLAMPIILQVEYESGAKENIRMPAEIWRRSPRHLKKLLVKDEKIRAFVVDPLLETADADIENNYYPRRIIPARIESYKAPESPDLAERDIMHNITIEADPEISE
ncbi:MAG: M1 family metallopeptidase [Gammaproteobacteria bacterium]|nr:M1 family metallopeptidase [Gammaproteobacteria bacterium]MCY4256323.1 M1 family metallopeptidase [Gammaproteobacteria bacterium]MCY4341797.1 M1 family metallopeptidase [Gammaproteobacteria bacterium]